MVGRVVIAALAMLLPAAAQAECAQKDLQGRWRFNFDLNRTATVDSIQRVVQMSCVLDISKTGKITPEECDGVDGRGEAGAFYIGSSKRKFDLNPKTCNVGFSGQQVFGNDFSLIVSGTEYYVNGAKLSLSADRQMMLGWLSVYGAAWATVTAMKIAEPGD